ncbi:MAG: hypothetical protein KDB69_02560 [Acidimicrobiia bacterium]|nr:hypothetical protein [Acidimicrobiia bacterium]
MRKTLITALVGLALVATACSIDVEANPDGSLTITSTVDERRLQAAIDSSIEDPAVERLEIEFHDGYLSFDGSGPDEDTGRINDVTFDARLSVEDGHLAVDLDNGTWNGEPMPLWLQEILDAELAIAIQTEAQKNPDSTLTSVEVADGQAVFVWRLETEASKRG